MTFTLKDPAPSNDEDKAIVQLFKGEGTSDPLKTVAGDKFVNTATGNEIIPKVKKVVIGKDITGIGWKYRWEKNGHQPQYDPNEYPVVRNKTGAFQDFNSLKTVEFEDGSSIKRIGWSAFRKCHNLETFNFSELTGLEEIMSQAFDPCGLKEVDLSGCSSLKTIYNSAFFQDPKDADQNNSLKITGLPDSITTIGTYAFKHTTGTSITIPDSVTAIHNEAFKDCFNLQSVTFINASTLNTLGSKAFSGTNYSSQRNPIEYVLDESTKRKALIRKAALERLFPKVTSMPEDAFD